ncbi:hypothetical protein [Prauserella rugosa]|uniref:Excreted virulence factor EspC (Type VII ESX diderm) n=1 Tax=Prauserella rugosa TaxID=43354 RepID=A0A660CKU7_9PSEU|nr:hypothetical protein [Prauserella rugosa]KMS89539.1 hypothetical protein ACZ91_19955 [Streptomyces regensis]TWH22253.1 hypothetical protein JD82_04130 [Prauserella rugosa]
MSGGQQVNADGLRAAGEAYAHEGEELKTAGSKIETNVSSEKVGKAWADVAKSYVDAISKYRDAVNKCGAEASGLGDKMAQAGKAYKDGETVSTETIASKGAEL